MQFLPDSLGNYNEFELTVIETGGGTLEGGRSQASSRKADILLPTLTGERVESELPLGAEGAPLISWELSSSVWQIWSQTHVLRPHYT